MMTTLKDQRGHTVVKWETLHFILQYKTGHLTIKSRTTDAEKVIEDLLSAYHYESKWVFIRKLIQRFI